MGSATVRSPACGSVVSVDVILQDGSVTAFAQEVRACLLGQASAALLGKIIMGRTLSEIETLTEDVAGMLRGNSPPPAPFDGYSILEPARAVSARHASVLLPLRATVAAMKNAATPMGSGQ